MDNEVKAKFCAFADRLKADDDVLDTGLKGADFHQVADAIRDLVLIPEIDLGSFAGLGNVRRLVGMDHLVDR